jgi:hypothetical protein
MGVGRIGGNCFEPIDGDGDGGKGSRWGFCMGEGSCELAVPFG